MLVRGAVEALAGCAEGDRGRFEEGLGGVVGAMGEVNRVMEGEFFFFFFLARFFCERGGVCRCVYQGRGGF